MAANDRRPDPSGTGDSLPASPRTERRERIARRKRKGTKRASDGTAGWVSTRRPVLRAVAIFVLLLGAFYAFEFTHPARGGARRAYLQMIAGSSARLLEMLGYETTVHGTSIRSPRFSVKIVRGCDALDPVAALIAAILASPVTFWTKIPGLLIGTASLLLINLLRVVSLFLVGVHFPAAFKTVHHDVWQALFVVLAVVAWVLWVQWATRNPTRKRHVHP